MILLEANVSLNIAANIYDAVVRNPFVESTVTAPVAGLNASHSFCSIRWPKRADWSNTVFDGIKSVRHRKIVYSDHVDRRMGSNKQYKKFDFLLIAKRVYASPKCWTNGRNCAVSRNSE